MNDISMRNRYRGAMVGTLFGDAMGAPVEWQTPEYVAEYFEKVGGYHFHDYSDPWAIRRGKRPNTVFAGQPTDDSELAAALAQSFVADPSLNPEDLYNRLRRFIHGRKAILSSRAYGQGGTLKAALEPETYEASKAKFAAGEIPTPPSNGSLMRCIPVPLRGYGRRLTDTLHDARDQSKVTHRNLHCLYACFAYSLLVRMVLSGKTDIRSLWENLPSNFEEEGTPVGGMTPEFKEILEISLTRPDYETEMKDKEGYVVLSLRVAVWAAAEATDFLDGIKKAISVGGDTDTYAAIAGGILGAKFGIEGIPADLLEELQGKEIMIDLADGLYDIAHS